MSGSESAEPKQWNRPPEMALAEGKTYEATLDTSKGEIRIKLLAEEAPKTVNNFVFLATEGFYDGVPFHRIMKGFMLQTGDPTGTGMGGPGYRFEDEPVQRSYDRGIVAMANAGPDTNGSQFFIVHQRAGLPANYTIFGELVEGLDTLDAIADTPVGASSSGEASSPQEDVRINKVTIEVS